MTETKAKIDKKPRRIKMRAMQRLFHDQRIVEEGEIFVHVGDALPDETIAVAMPPETPLGVPPEEPSIGGRPAPTWTTQGYVKQSIENTARADHDLTQ